MRTAYTAEKVNEMIEAIHGSQFIFTLAERESIREKNKETQQPPMRFIEEKFASQSPVNPNIKLNQPTASLHAQPLANELSTNKSAKDTNSIETENQLNRMMVSPQTETFENVQPREWPPNGQLNQSAAIDESEIKDTKRKRAPSIEESYEPCATKIGQLHGSNQAGQHSAATITDAKLANVTSMATIVEPNCTAWVEGWSDKLPTFINVLASCDVCKVYGHTIETCVAIRHEETNNTNQQPKNEIANQ